MRTTFGVLMLILISLPIMLSAKDRDTGTWLDLTVSKKVGKTIIGCTGEFYTRSDNSSIDRTSIGLKAEYPLLPWLNGCLGYTLMNYKKPGYLELRDRFYGHLESFVHYKGFIFSLRERFHLT
ncbi:MAG: DUF2490 domain-containing protein, partial [Marinilabiliales bacterium]|nr:DUF2490 domain-containing protein [Marinilabiliales bacterium]